MISLAADAEVGLEMGWLVQQNRQKQGLSQKDLAVVSACTWLAIICVLQQLEWYGVITLRVCVWAVTHTVVR